MFDYQFTCKCGKRSLRYNTTTEAAALEAVVSVERWRRTGNSLLCSNCAAFELGPKRKKYNNRKTVTDGITFDSQLEATHYDYLKRLQATGEITDLKLQQPFELLPAFRDATGKKHRAIKYIADFTYRRGGVLVVCDTKGVRTQTFNIKHKMFLYRYPTIVFEIVEKPAAKSRRKAA